MNPFSLKGKNLLITGGSSGIGRQCAITCNKMGAQIILIGRREEKLIESVKLLRNGENLFYAVDIKNNKEIEGIISDAVKKIGPLHGFIHSAGIELTMPLSITKLENYFETFSINVFAGFEFARIISKIKYLSPEGASYVFIASVRGFLGEKAQTVYCSSKGAIIAGTKALALELAEKKIRVNSISPGMIERTELTLKLQEKLSEKSIKNIYKMYPLGFGETIDVANGCVYLLSDASKWITGINLIIDGGYSAK